MKLRIAKRYQKLRPMPPRRKSMARHMASHQRAEKILLRHSAEFRKVYRQRMLNFLSWISGGEEEIIRLYEEGRRSNSSETPNS
jgi:hypothetical protein